MANCLVAGAGGFIGGHLVNRLLADGHEVVCADIKPEEDWWQVPETADVNSMVDLREYHICREMCGDLDTVFNLACDMGGIGFIENNKADCMTSVLINTNLLRAAADCEVSRYFYSSSACVYHALRQDDPGQPALREEDAYYQGGAMPEDGYGWEKLFSERMCRHFYEDYGIETRVARFHNIYGPHGSWNDGREKAPAALCRKVAEAKLSRSKPIEVWGAPDTTRSFCWIDDCVEGIIRLTNSDVREPLNIGSSEQVFVAELVDIISKCAGWSVRCLYDPNAPKGVAGRNSDNTKIQELLGWQPTTGLEDGIPHLYEWVERQVRNSV